jgi:hypothetical protein
MKKLTILAHALAACSSTTPAPEPPKPEARGPRPEAPKADAPKPTAPLEAGVEAPDFEAVAHNGATVKLSAMRGKPIVLYFYPKDETPG